MNKLPSRIDSDYNGVQAVCDGLGDRVSLEDVRCMLLILSLFSKRYAFFV